jgi:hypothetical protein
MRWCAVLTLLLFVAPAVAYTPPASIDLVLKYPRPVCTGDCRNITALDQPYLIGVASAGGVTCGCGVLLIFVYWFWLCCSRCACCCFRSVKPKSTRVGRLVLLICFVASGALTLGCIAGADHVKLGVDDILQGIGKAVVFFDGIDTDTDQLITQTALYQTNADTLEENCPAEILPVIEQIKAAAIQANTAATDLKTQLSGVQTQVDDFDAKAKQQPIKRYVESFAIVSILMICISCVLGAWGALRKSSCSLTLASALGVFMLFFVVLLVSAELSVNIFLADLCFQDPLIQMQDIVSGNAGLDAETLENVQYFFTCAGESPIRQYFADAQDQINTLRDEIGQLQPQIANCLPPAQPAFAALEATIADSDTTLAAIQESVSCDAVNSILKLLLQDGTCVDIASGMFSFWTTQAAAGLCLLTTLFLSSYMQACWKAERREAEYGDANNPLLPERSQELVHEGDGEFVPVAQGVTQPQQGHAPSLPDEYTTGGYWAEPAAGSVEPNHSRGNSRGMRAGGMKPQHDGYRN